MVALNAPADADFTGINAIPDHAQADGWWHYELSCATDRWRNACF
ncbi:hypothetical protein [Streptomyces chryseus]|nr:hypothetical protein [Streptomyces chryseus]GGX23613.1 hypothetical protein GCM10010353_43310 [Streptomyces chryseus]